MVRIGVIKGGGAALLSKAIKPPSGFQAVPGSKHGGYRKQIAGKWQYWYPDEASRSKAEDYHYRQMDAARPQKIEGVDDLHTHHGQVADGTARQGPLAALIGDQSTASAVQRRAETKAYATPMQPKHYDALQALRRELTTLSSQTSNVDHPVAKEVEKKLDAIRQMIFDIPHPFSTPEPGKRRK